MSKARVNMKVVLLAAAPYPLLGYPWFSVFRDPWFRGGGLTVEQLQQGPSYAVAFAVAIASALVTAYVLAFLVAATGELTVVRGIKMAALVWIAFIGVVMGTQHTFEARPLAYFAITAGYPLIGLVIMGAIIGGSPGRSDGEAPQNDV